jgi:hypothetical protein
LERVTQVKKIKMFKMELKKENEMLRVLVRNLEKQVKSLQLEIKMQEMNELAFFAAKDDIFNEFS